MSQISVNIHGLVDIAGKHSRGDTVSWVDLEFNTENGSQFGLTLFMRGDNGEGDAHALTTTINALRKPETIAAEQAVAC